MAPMILSDDLYGELEDLVLHTPLAKERCRAQAVLWLAEGLPAEQIADTFQVSRQTVYNWAERFRQREGLDLRARLLDAPRSGRPPLISGIIDPLIEAAFAQDPRELGYQSNRNLSALLLRFLYTPLLFCRSPPPHDRLFSPRESHTIPSYNLADRLADRAEAIWAARKQKLDGQRPAASQVREGGICTVAVLRGALRRPGRRIGQRGDATRAPTQEPRPERAARCRPVFPFRDWYETGKSTSLNPENSISR